MTIKERIQLIKFIIGPKLFFFMLAVDVTIIAAVIYVLFA